MNSPGSRWMAGDAVALTVALGIALSPFTDSYAGGRWIVAAGLGLALGLAVTLLARTWRLGAVGTALVAAAGYLLVGPAAAAPLQAAAGVLPNADSVRQVVVGLVRSWRSVLTLPVPLGSERGELVVPFVTATVAALLASTFLWRTRHPAVALVPVLAAFVTAAAFGTQMTGLPLVRGGLLAVVLLLWLRWRSLRDVRTSWPRRVALGLALVSVAGVASWGAAVAVGDAGTRDVLRDHIDPPLSRLDFKSPLARFRDFYKDHEQDVLFRFDGVPAGDPRVRLATMDSFDGHVWNVATTDLMTGTSAFRPAPAAGASGVGVTVAEYDGPWVPSIELPTATSLIDESSGGAERELLINTASGTVAMHGDTRSGDVYRVDWLRRQTAAEKQATAADRSVPLSRHELPPIGKLEALVQGWTAGAADDYDMALALEKGFHDNGWFNDGLPADQESRGFSTAGHGAKRLADLVADPERMVGNDEQYASAMAFAAQRMGLPARVVLGFRHIGDDGAVTGDDIAAWVEIPFVEVGWVAFDPTPDEDRIPPKPSDSPNPRPQPYVVQPPVLPDQPADVEGVPPEALGEDRGDSLWELVLAALRVLWVATKVLLLLAPLWLVLLFKWWRRRRRRRAPDPVTQVSGAWRELSDHARDLGARIPAGHTRHEASQVLAARFPEAGPTALAAVADRHVFGGSEPSPDDVQAYWADVDTALVRMRRSVPWSRRLLGRLSPASIPWRRLGTRTRGWVGRAVRRLDRTSMRGLRPPRPRRRKDDA